LVPTRAHGRDLGPRFTVAMVFVERAGRDFRQQLFPICLEAGAGQFERLGRVTAVLSWMKAGIEAATPTPLININWHARALANRADMHVAVVNVPSLMVAIGAAAAGQGGHRP
jgi:hypothetical protein